MVLRGEVMMSGDKNCLCPAEEEERFVRRNLGGEADQLEPLTMRGNERKGARGIRRLYIEMLKLLWGCSLKVCMSRYLFKSFWGCTLKSCSSRFLFKVLWECTLLESCSSRWLVKHSGGVHWMVK